MYICIIKENMLFKVKKLYYYSEDPVRKQDNQYLRHSKIIHTLFGFVIKVLLKIKLKNNFYLRYLTISTIS